MAVDLTGTCCLSAGMTKTSCCQREEWTRKLRHPQNRRCLRKIRASAPSLTQAWKPYARSK